jgi:hypothetical protein
MAPIPSPATSTPSWTTPKGDIHEGNPNAKLSILVRVEGDDAKRLERIANERGRLPGEVISEFLRST